MRVCTVLDRVEVTGLVPQKCNGEEKLQVRQGLTQSDHRVQNETGT
jgi:hypothetical protein